MKDNMFHVLVDAIKVMEHDTTDANDVKNSIKDMLEHFEKDLTKEQKNAMLTEYMDYEKKIKTKKERKIFLKRLEEERYREMLNSFLNDNDEAF